MITNYVSKADKIFIENIQDILNNGTSTALALELAEC